MKIAQIVCTIPPYGGGIGKVAHKYAEKLTDLGHEVDVLVPKSKSFRKLKTNYNVIQLRPWLKYGHAAVLPQLLWKLGKYDVVHLHFPFFGATFFLCLLKKIKKQKLKLVFSYHMDVLSSGIKGRFFKFYNWHVLHKHIQDADKIIVSSYDYVQNSNIAEYFYNHKEKFVELPFGVPRIFSPQKKNPSLLKKYGFSQADKIVGFVGGLDSAHYFKGINYLITAVSKIEDENVKALIVGEGNLKKKYIDQAESLGIKERVVFAGYIEDEILPEYYNLFDVFILPSVDKSEAFGIVLVEAMACAKPLIASNLKGVRSVLVPGDNGFLVEPKNSSDIAEKIQFLFNHADLMKQFGQRGIELVDSKYRWPIIAQRLQEVYREIL